MSASVDLGAIARNLETYHQQLSALRQALGALSELSDVMLAAIDSDRAAIAAHANLQGAAHADATATDPIEHHAQPGAAIDENSAGQFDRELSMALGLEPADKVEGQFNGMGSVIDAVADALVMPEPASGEAVIVGEAIPMPAFLDMQAAPKTTADHTEAARLQSGNVTALDGAKLAAIATAGGKVIELRASRSIRQAGGHYRRRVMTVAACLLLTASATLGIYQLAQSDFGHRLSEIGSCDGDMLSGNRDCGLLAWLML